MTATEKDPIISEQAARIRAARNYRGITQPAMAKTMGISVSSLSRIERGIGGRIDESGMRSLARTCDVPEWFMLHGFDVPVELDQPAALERLEALESQMQTVLQIVAIRGVLPVGEPSPQAQTEGQ